MKTTISVLAVLILTVLLGFTFTPENTNDSNADISSDCCMSGFSQPGAIINAYYNGVLLDTETTSPAGTFTICVDPSPVTVTSTYNGYTSVRKGVYRCATGVRFTDQDN